MLVDVSNYHVPIVWLQGDMEMRILHVETILVLEKGTCQRCNIQFSMIETFFKVLPHI